MKAILVLLIVFLVHSNQRHECQAKAILAPLFGSAEHNTKHTCQPIGPLNPKMILTLTVVTGGPKLDKTKLVAAYFASFKFLTITDEADMHFKIKGLVDQLSNVFNTSFVEYKCSNSPSNSVKYASTTEVYIPESLQSAFKSILGLETVLAYGTYHRELPQPSSVSEKSSATTFEYFTGNQAAQVYGAPNGTGSSIRVGIITLGGFFNQSDLQAYFNQFGLGKAPTINIVYVDGAAQNQTDIVSTGENYLDIEIVASIVPQANISLYFAPNTNQGFYDVIYQAIVNSDIVSCSWGGPEKENPKSYMGTFQALFAKYSNVPFFAASGDSGSFSRFIFSYGGVLFPASCPNAIGILIFF
jgi:kumamolisin